MKPLFIGYSENNERLELTDDDLETHVHGVGASRSGKSKFLEWVARELIRRPQGFCLIDPHGSLYDDLVRWLTYLRPNREIVLFNPAAEGRIVGFNPFARRGGDVSVQVDRRIRATVKVWGAAGTDETPRLERWLRSIYHILLTLGYPVGVARYLVSWEQAAVRRHLVGSLPPGFIRDEWEGLSAYKRPQDFDGQVESARNRLVRFIEPLQIRRITGLSFNNLDLEDIIENGKILLVNLQPFGDALTEENARLLGTLLLNEIWEVAMRRKTLAGGRAPSSWFLMIDEFQKFLTPDIPAMLNEGAKRGIHLFLFHQHLRQLQEQDEQIYGAVMTNARVKLVFGGLEREDARILAENIFPGQLDLKRIKFLIEQTKFWPVYTREKTYASSRGGAHSTTSATGSGSGMGWDPAEQAWVPTSSESRTDGDADVESWSEGEQDIPFLKPEPFKEVSSITPYSLEELLWEISDRLMEQYKRHFMIRRPGQQTVAAITPFVKTWHVEAERVAQYLEKRLAAFLPAAEVDRALFEGQQKLLQAAGVPEAVATATAKDNPDFE